MWNNGNDCGCLWIILIIILLCCCCGGGMWGNNNCGCGCGKSGITPQTSDPYQEK